MQRHRTPPYPPPAMPAQPKPQFALPPRPRKRGVNWWIVAPLLGVLAVIISSAASLVLVLALVYAGGILPGVSSGGIALGGQSQQEAVATLQNNWQRITLRDDQRTWAVNPVELGIFLDASQTAAAAYQQGRGRGDGLQAMLGQVEIVPVINNDPALAEAGLNGLAAQVEMPPVNAGVRLVNGQVEATPPTEGRALDVSATIARLGQDANELLADGELELAMYTVAPTVTDASPMVAQATQLLSSFLDIRIYDPVTDDTVFWSLSPEEWGTWLTVAPDADSATGLALTIDGTQAQNYLTSQSNSVFDASRYINMDEAIASVRQAVADGRTDPFVRVYHHDLQHTVQAGETIISIAWDYGVPYPWIQNSNSGIGDVLSAGQVITIPSADNFLPYPVVPDKRIVVSISQQRAWIFEHDSLKWEWPVSTGINSSPTWPGIYQIQSHETNAYAENWDLWMPNFMGVYQPIPGLDFTNGFHGFPTRGGSQLLWTDSLGTRVTYGCILLSNDNVQQLYAWAEEGVVVEIQA